MLHIYKDAITGRVYQVYDDEPPDRDDPEEDKEEDDEEEDWQDVYRKELDRYSDWLYK